jgi:hypothetical protein
LEIPDLRACVRAQNAAQDARSSKEQRAIAREWSAVRLKCALTSRAEPWVSFTHRAAVTTPESVASISSHSSPVSLCQTLTKPSPDPEATSVPSSESAWIDSVGQSMTH